MDAICHLDCKKYNMKPFQWKTKGMWLLNTFIVKQAVELGQPSIGIQYLWAAEIPGWAGNTWERNLRSEEYPLHWGTLEQDTLPSAA